MDEVIEVPTTVVTKCSCGCGANLVIEQSDWQMWRFYTCGKNPISFGSGIGWIKTEPTNENDKYVMWDYKPMQKLT